MSNLKPSQVRLSQDVAMRVGPLPSSKYLVIQHQ